MADELDELHGHEVDALRSDKETGQSGGKSEVQKLGDSPKCRRVLKGHFGKVYAMHWSGDAASQAGSGSGSGSAGSVSGTGAAGTGG